MRFVRNACEDGKKGIERTGDEVVFEKMIRRVAQQLGERIEDSPSTQLISSRTAGEMRMRTNG